MNQHLKSAVREIRMRRSVGAGGGRLPPATRWLTGAIPSARPDRWDGWFGIADYRRADVAGGTYFFTVNLGERKRTLLVDHVDLLRAVMNLVKRRRPFHIDAMVILPDHLHAVWTLPVSDCDYEAGFSRRIAKDERCNKSRIAEGERGIWQRRYWEHRIRDEQDYARHVDYVHYNPVTYGYVECVGDWPHSTFHRLVARGIYPPDWADVPESELEAGERV